jgi:hypothetical protein
MISSGFEGSRVRREQIFQRRRRVALGVFLAVFFGLAWATSSFVGGGDSDDATADAEAPELPRGGRQIFPRYRVVGFYGAPQDPELGALGIGTPADATRKLLDQARAYSRPSRPVLPALELIATIAHAAPGVDGLHRERQSPAVIKRYLAAARRIKALLILDVQPGQSTFFDEVRALEPYLTQPDVGLALDSEWNVPEGVVPGQTIGSTDAATVNSVSYYLARLVRRYRLPQKALLVHQFTEGMVKDDDQELLARPGVAIVSNIDGFGLPAPKVDVYKRLANRPPLNPRVPRLFNGLKLFYEEDTNLMSPASVLSLTPEPDVVVYE